jgi:5-methylthioadenosine/S-adenosylhomocysteine deaminase
LIFTADVVFPVSSPPIPNGAILVQEGRIAVIGTLEDARTKAPEAEIQHYEGCAITPGAINTHAHLGFRRDDAPEGGTFAGWLGRLIERLPEKESWTPEAAKNSANEAIVAGTTFMAESSPYGECLPQLAESGMAGAVFAEFFPGDFPDTQPEERVEEILKQVHGTREGLPERVSAQVSVHSVYTVDPDSSRVAALKTRELGDPLAIHLSESPEEVEFVREGTGGLANIFGSNTWGGAGVSPVRYAENVELLAPTTIAAHLATGVSDEDIDILTRTGVAAAHCPRSNDFLGCEVSPVPEMMRRGVRVGMGTDGLWSSPSMNLFEETMFAVKVHGFDGELGLRLATLEGARALNIERETGSLEVGKWADLAIVKVEGGDQAALDVLESAASGGVAATVVSGNLIYNRE